MRALCSAIATGRSSSSTHALLLRGRGVVGRRRCLCIPRLGAIGRRSWLCIRRLPAAGLHLPKRAGLHGWLLVLSRGLPMLRLPERVLLRCLLLVLRIGVCPTVSVRLLLLPPVRTRGSGVTTGGSTHPGLLRAAEAHPGRPGHGVCRSDVCDLHDHSLKPVP